VRSEFDLAFLGGILEPLTKQGDPCVKSMSHYLGGGIRRQADSHDPPLSKSSRQRKVYRVGRFS